MLPWRFFVINFVALMGVGGLLIKFSKDYELPNIYDRLLFIGGSVTVAFGFFAACYALTLWGDWEGLTDRINNPRKHILSDIVLTLIVALCLIGLAALGIALNKLIRLLV